MTLRAWKHATAFGIAAAAVLAAVFGLMGELLAAFVGAVVAAVLGLAMHWLSEVEGRREREADQERMRELASVRRSDAIAVPTTAGASDPHDQITEAFTYVAQGRPDIAIDRLTDLKRKHWDQLSPRARYRLLANLGSVKLVSRDRAGAARDYLRALDYQPSDEDARSFAALGHLLLGEVEQAQRLAIELCWEHPTLDRAQMIRIRTAPKDISLDELRRSVPSAVRGMPEVALALHDRALEEGRADDAEWILRERAEPAEGWAPLTLALGSTILQQELAAMRITLEGPVIVDRTRLSEAVDLFTTSISQIPQSDPEEFAFGAHMNRGVARTLLGEHPRAQVDFQRARQLKPSDEQAVLALAKSVYLGRRDLEEGISILEDYLTEHTSDSVELLLAEFLRQRGGTSDLDRAVDILMVRLAHLGDLEDEEQRVGAVEILVDVYLKTGRSDLALGVVDDVSTENLGSVARSTILGDALRRVGRKEDAVGEARRAKDALDESSTPIEVERLALLLERLGEYGEALELWRRIVPPEFVSPETHHLLHCAKEAGEHEFVLEFCQQLRVAGYLDHGCLGYEIEVLVEYGEYAKARDVLVNYVETNPRDKIARLNLAILALRYGWDDVTAAGSDLPTVEELDNAEIGGKVADILRAGPNPVQAVDYAYELYRRFPDEPEAQRALIMAVLAPGPAGLHIDKPEAVAAGTAVCYTEVGSEEQRWVVVEDSKNPSLTRGEYPISHPLVGAMLGKAVGEEFLLSEISLRESKGTIVEIKDKRVYRFNELLERWRERFPDIPFFEAIPVRVADTPTPEDFAELQNVMKSLTERREQVEQAYAEGKLPIATLALFNGRTVFETVDYLSASPALPVRASRGSTNDFDEAFQILNQAEVVVLDPSAVATLALVGELSALELLPFRCLVTERTLQELRDLAREDLAAAPAGYMGYKDGRLWIEEVRPEQEAERRERLKDVVSKLEQVCEIVGGSDLAGLEVVKRQQLVECIASASAQAAAIANERGVVLWTDDHLLYELVKCDLPSARVWTQAVFLWLHDNDRIDGTRNSHVTARMLRFGYVFTSLSSAIVLESCESAAWQLENPDLAAVLAEFGNTTWDHESARSIVEQTLARLWREAPTVEHARAIAARLLTHLADRQDHQRIVRHLLVRVTSLLGFAVTRVGPLRETLEVFLRKGVATL